MAVTLLALWGKMSIMPRTDKHMKVHAP